MIKLTINNTPVELRFQHEPYNEQTKTRATNVALKIGDYEIFGRAVCKHGDNYDYYKGRKRALTNLLKHSSLDKEMRTALWTAFFETRDPEFPQDISNALVNLRRLQWDGEIENVINLMNLLYELANVRMSRGKKR